MAQTAPEVPSATASVTATLTDGSQLTQVVDALGVLVDFATNADQTSGNHKTQIVDPGGVSITQTGGSLDINLKTADISLGTANVAEFAYGAGALTNAYSAITLTSNAADGNATAIPTRCFVDTLALAFDTVVTAVSVDVYIANDAAGKYPVSHPVNVAFQLSLTATFYVAVADIKVNRRIPAVGTANNLYLIIKTNAGTANVIARLNYTP